MEQLTMVPYEYFGYTVKMDERESQHSRTGGRLSALAML
jgi:hypothetical protein